MGSSRHKKARAQRKAVNARRAQSLLDRYEAMDGANGFLRSGAGRDDAHLTMSQEARNTERHQINYNVQLRNLGIKFVSAGDLRRDDLEILTEEKENGMVDDENARTDTILPTSEEARKPSPHPEPDVPANGMEQDNEAQTSRPPSPGVHSAEENLFFYDYGEDKSFNKSEKLPQPQVDIDSEHSDPDSSEDEVVFAGRGRVARHPFAPDHSSTVSAHQPNIESSRHPTSIDDSVYLPATSGAEPSLRRESPLSHSGPQSSRESDWQSISTPPNAKSAPHPGRNTRSRQRYTRSSDENDEDDILADYIANMDYGDSSDDDTDASAESEQSDVDHVEGVPSDEGLTLPDELPDEISRVFSMRQSGKGFEYLVIGVGQGPDEARWVRKELLTMPGAGESIRIFEEQAVLSPHGTHGIIMDEPQETVSDEEEEEQDAMADEMDQTMTDEQLARAIAEQDMLGLGHSDGLFGGEDLDDFGYVAQGLKSKKGKKKKNRGARTEFPSASAFADALDEDPYGAFDIMDFDRPSLKKKPKGRHQNVPDFGLSDSDLAWELQGAWDNDRKKKKMKKREREELRAMGLLGNKDGKVNIKAKYSEGMSFDNIKQEIRAFLLSPLESLSLPPMDKKDRKTVHEIANMLSLKSLSRGHGSSRFPILTKTMRTPDFNLKHMNDVEKVFSSGRFARRTDKGRSKRGGGIGTPPKARGGTRAASHMDGDVVGASAPEIGIENKGRVMLEKMGWSTGTALGAVHNKGILQPVAHIVKNTKAGLG